MKIYDAQKDMCDAFVSGAPGVLISGIIWIAAGLAAMQIGFQKSILLFFFGGMLIYPLSLFASKTLNGKQSPKPDNPLVKLGLESTFILFVGLFIAYMSLQISEAWFYPVMLLTIGVRYFIFSTIYGLKIYWALAILLILAGAALLMWISAPPYVAALIGGSLEIIFSIVLFSINKRQLS